MFPGFLFCCDLASFTVVLLIGEISGGLDLAFAFRRKRHHTAGIFIYLQEILGNSFKLLQINFGSIFKNQYKNVLQALSQCLSPPVLNIAWLDA